MLNVLNLVALIGLCCLPLVQSTDLEACNDWKFDAWTNNEVIVDVHRNGEAAPCGSIKLTPDDLSVLNESGKCSLNMNKFEVEAFLTQVIADKLDDHSCLNLYDETPSPGFLGHCDRGETYTPILMDHDKLVRLPTGSLPCRLYTREGLRISSIDQFVKMAMEKEQICELGQADCGTVAHIHVSAASAGRVFMFAPSFVGEIFQLPHVDVTSGLPVYLEVLNTNPRVFEIHNFFNREESDQIVSKAMNETSETHRIKRSTTGTGEHTVFAKRTSESGFDTHGETAQKVKRRCMKALGFDEYIEGHTDGLQVLRYNATKAYVQHMDYMTDTGGREAHDFDSQFKGGNRYATILLYMTDLEPGEGGETLFSEAWPPELPEVDRKSFQVALEELRESGDASLLTKNSWEEKMVANCRRKFSVRPSSAKAVLFYSQLPDGKKDPESKHGGCPVLNPDKPKWAANLWVWNTPRQGFPGSPVKAGMEKDAVDTQKQLKATFKNSGTDSTFQNAELYYDESGYWGKIGFGEGPLVAFTYPGHKWNIKVGGKFVKQFTIGTGEVQEFSV